MTVEARVKHLRAWSLRLLMAMLLMAGCELLLWPVAPDERSLREWLFLLPAYIALATLALDLMARYRARDLYDVMIVAGIVGLLVGLIVNPETALIEFPRTLLTRVMGGYVALSLGMLGLWAVLTAGQFPRYRLLLLGYAVFGGFYWGTWMRWSAAFTDRMAEPVTLERLAMTGGVFLALVLGAFALVGLLRRADIPAEATDMQLPPAGLGILVAVLLVLFLVGVLEGRVPGGDSLAAILALLAFCMMLLWFRRPNKPRQLLDAHLPPEPLSPLWILLAVAVFAAMTAFTYDLSRLEFLGVNQLTLMEWGFTGFGMIWLPIATTFIGLRAVTRLTAWRGGE
jgi:hypothetical protein